MVRDWVALASVLALTGCVATEQQRSGFCESGAEGDIFFKSTACDGYEMTCDGRDYAFQRIFVINRTTNAAAITIDYGDGTQDKFVLPASDNYRAEKPLGMGATLVAQC